MVSLDHPLHPCSASRLAWPVDLPVDLGPARSDCVVVKLVIPPGEAEMGVNVSGCAVGVGVL